LFVYLYFCFLQDMLHKILCLSMHDGSLREPLGLFTFFFRTTAKHTFLVPERKRGTFIFVCVRASVRPSVRPSVRRPFLVTFLPIAAKPTNGFRPNSICSMFTVGRKHKQKLRSIAFKPKKLFNFEISSHIFYRLLQKGTSP
jgi:hypothetical protein